MNNTKKIIVCDNNKKNQLLANTNQLLDITYITLDDFLSKVSFSYDYEALYSVMKDYKLNYDSAKVYLSNLFYLNLINDNNFYENKINKLKEIYNHLNEKGLIKYDKLFIKSLKNKEIIIDSSFLDSNKKIIIDNKLKGLNYKYVDLYENPKYRDDYLFDCDIYENINYEVNNVVEKIASLLDSGININNIKIVLGSNNYLNTVLRSLNLYNLPYNAKKITSLGNIEISKRIINEYFNGELDLNNYDSSNEVINKTVDVINKYALLENDDIKREIIIKDLKNVYKQETRYIDAIEIVYNDELSNFINDEMIHTFVLGFSEGSFPKNYKDEGFFSSFFLEENGLTTPNELNYLEKKKTINILLSINNLHLSTSMKTNFDSLVVSSLALDKTKKEGLKGDLEYSKYSNELNKSLYSTRRTNFDKYNEVDPSLPCLVKTYASEIVPFDNSFKGLDINEYLKNKNYSINISYSSLDNYYHCPFKYYLNNVLGFNQFDTNFSTVIGGAYHEVLEHSFDNDLKLVDCDRLKIYDDYILESGYEFSESEKYLNEKIRLEVLDVVKAIDEQNKLLNYTNGEYEHRIQKEYDVDIDGKKLKVVFKGFIDKLFYVDKVIDGKNVRFYSVVDYKTGTSTKFEKNLVQFGLSLQLLTYIYLENYELSTKGIEGISGGMFLQHILTKLPMDDEERIKDLKFDGLYNNDENIIRFFNEMNDSGVKLESVVDKTSSRTSEENRAFIDSNIVKEYIDIVGKKTDEAIDNIKKASFPVKPIRVEGKTEKDGCTYCKYQDICFKTFDNYDRKKLD